MQSFNPIEDLFKGRHFDRQIIIMCVSWYTSFKLSSLDLVITIGDRGISLPRLRSCGGFSTIFQSSKGAGGVTLAPFGGSWRMDETYIKVHGQWVYLYRAVARAGQTVDFFLSRNRDVNAAKSFLHSAMKNTRVPTKITLDAYAASHRAVREMKQAGELPRRVKVRSSRHLNNLVEQDHRRVKQRIHPMLGFKRFDNAAVKISGIELAEKIKKRTIQDAQAGRPKGDDVGVVERGTRCLSPSQFTEPGGEPNGNPCRREFAPEPGLSGSPCCSNSTAYTKQIDRFELSSKILINFEGLALRPGFTLEGLWLLRHDNAMPMF
jgi:transposase-like protein